MKKEELKEGMYVRTLKGIAKIIGKNDDVRFHYPLAYICDRYLEINDDTEYLYEEDIIKSSYNIIDLIEKGDYVNGFKIDDITEKDEDHHERIAWHLTYYGDDDIPFRNDEIKSIVTKEQFEAMEYKL